MSARRSLIGSPCWVGLTSSDPARAVEFHARLFGWSSEVDEDPRYDGYVTLLGEGGPVAGIARQQPENPAGDVWTVCFETADAAAAAEQVRAAGGDVLRPARPVGDKGTLALVTDPAGAVLGLWQPHLHPGFARWCEPGAPAWFETFSRDYRAVLPFYETVFGWEMTPIADTDEFRYAQATLDGTAVAGVLDAVGMLPSEVPSFWRWYVAVEDADDTVTAALSLGGAVAGPAQDSPYGRAATVADPMGAQVVVVSRESW